MEQTLPLRQKVLWPDLSLAQLMLPEDSNGIHLGAFIPQQREHVAVISLFIEPLPIDNKSHHCLDNVSPASNDADLQIQPGVMVRFRKFACEPDYQGYGIGTRLLRYALSIARDELHGSILWCDARVTAVDWYTRRGMSVTGRSFYKGPVEYVA
ncbi:GCN5-related N-acetyltransferase [Pluteus cervinus]|uniref:GCN5-related N-acetyltransferase n=1 Tax=Pluteus cervinus TaxID=181527 RepID=A0ACD3AT56_9AGAR|nr:GCN5-related N-acetyltransferase [Pluteus cervinus]